MPSNENDSEYYEAMLELLEWIWGRDYMAPGGEGNVDRLVAGLDLGGRKVLDIGSGLGGPAFYMARKYGAQVTGIDLEPHLVERASTRAFELGMKASVEFRLARVGPLDFPDNQFDLVISSGAVTQTSDKDGLFSEAWRVLKPGGMVSCYEWMKCEGEYSKDMLHWFELEGLTYELETLETHGTILSRTGFVDIELEDVSSWYRRESRKEYELLSGGGYETVVQLIGRADADHLIEDWRVMTKVCENGEMRQGYCRGRKPGFHSIS